MRAYRYNLLSELLLIDAARYKSQETSVVAVFLYCLVLFVLFSTGETGVLLRPRGVLVYSPPCHCCCFFLLPSSLNIDEGNTWP